MSRLNQAAENSDDVAGERTKTTSDGVVGETVEKIDGWGLVTGKARYTDDVATDDALSTHILRSPHAHARIRSIDTSSAEALDGVKAVLTHEDVPDERFTRTGFPHPAPAPFDERIMNETVRFVGEPVAAVAAETRAVAEHACSTIDVEYDRLEHVLDAEKAMEPESPAIHGTTYENEQDNADPERNIVCETRHEEGDVETAFEEADHVVEGTYETQVVQHTPMEVNTAIAWIDERDRLVLRTGTQVSHICRDKLARIFDRRRTDVRVIKPRVGGGFGMKQDLVPCQFIAAALAIETGEKVHVRNDREEDLHVSQTRHAQTIHVTTGVQSDGDIVAQHIDITSNTGAYGCHAHAVMTNSGHEPMSVYPCENRLFTGRAVYTNSTPGGAMRGYGGVQGTFALESHLDEAAAEVGMDPVEFRRHNTITEGEEGFEPEFSTNEGALQSVGIDECIDEACAAIDWDSGPNTPDDDRYRRGYGIALTMHKSGVANREFAGCDVTLESDGTITVRSGIGDSGQGAETTIGQIVAGVLGIDIDDIHVKADDTDATPWDNGAYASSTTYVSGNAAEKAARNLAEQIRALASERFDTDPESVELIDGELRSGDGESVSLATFAEEAFDGLDGPMRRLIGRATHHTSLSPKPFAAQIAEVEVDTKTGEFAVLQLVSAADCGRVINPANARGQVVGGAVMGLGQALSEELTFTDDGTPEQNGLLDYDVIHAPDIPEMEEILVESHEPTGPFGAKSIGEVAILGPPAAVANALKDAVGVRISDLPLTPEKVIAATESE